MVCECAVASFTGYAPFLQVEAAAAIATDDATNLHTAHNAIVSI